MVKFTIKENNVRFISNHIPEKASLKFRISSIMWKSVNESTLYIYCINECTASMIKPEKISNFRKNSARDVSLVAFQRRFVETSPLDVKTGLTFRQYLAQ